MTLFSSLFPIVCWLVYNYAVPFVERRTPSLSAIMTMQRRRWVDPRAVRNGAELGNLTESASAPMGTVSSGGSASPGRGRGRERAVHAPGSSQSGDFGGVVVDLAGRRQFRKSDNRPRIRKACWTELTRASVFAKENRSARERSGSGGVAGESGPVKKPSRE